MRIYLNISALVQCLLKKYIVLGIKRYLPVLTGLGNRDLFY